MPLFSERNGYIKVSDILIKEDVPDLVANAISSAFEGACNVLDDEGDKIWELLESVPDRFLRFKMVATIFALIVQFLLPGGVAEAPQ